MNIKKAIAKVFSANFIQLLAGIIVGFVVPVILPIEGYAELKTYTLLISYVGLLHFGYLDGLYIKYGGKNFKDIDKGVLKGEHKFIAIAEMVISLLILVIGIITKNLVFVLFAITILPANLCTFYKGVFQATGEFNQYTKVIKVYTLTYTALNIILAVLLKSKIYVLYCLAIFISHSVTLMIFEIKLRKNYGNVKSIKPTDIKEVTKTGILVLLGNLSVVALFGIDKWFVKLFLTTEDFAYYSFAVSMLNIINTLVNAISVTFYNYLFTNNSNESIEKLKNYLITLGGFASLGYFALAFIVKYFIEKYIPSLNIIAITFSVFPYMILINALYVNLYKVNKNEKKYFKVVVSMLIISIIYNIIAVVIFKNTISIAFATILTLITWVIYSTYDLKNVKTTKKMYIYMFSLTTFFLICTQCFNWLVGGMIYFVIFITLTWLLNKNVIKECYEMLSKSIKKLKDERKKENDKS